MSEVPTVKILEAINPANSGSGEEVLVYDGLTQAVDRYRQTNSERTAAFWDAEPDSLKETTKAKQLAFEYFLNTAAKVIGSHAGNHDLWADRFTQASIELYGEPDAAEATRLVQDEYAFVSQLRGRDDVSQPHVEFLISQYEPIIMGMAEAVTDTDSIEREKQAIAEYGQAIRSKYQPLFDMVDESGQAEFSATDLYGLFESSLSWLQTNDDPGWREWDVIATDGTSLSVDSPNRQIKIATRRPPAKTEVVHGLVAHELLTHALRGNNGHNTGDRGLATGLAGYLDAEEGLGVLSEQAVTGEKPVNPIDRYLDISFALGTINGTQLTRKEVFELGYARQLVRGQAKGELSESDIVGLKQKVWGQIDRVYRGGRGETLGSSHAVFTKDIAYYVGYKKMAEYITEQLSDGLSANDVFKYLSQAKFDPTNQKHLDRLNP